MAKIEVVLVEGQGPAAPKPPPTQPGQASGSGSAQMPPSPVVSQSIAGGDTGDSTEVVETIAKQLGLGSLVAGLLKLINDFKGGAAQSQGPAAAPPTPGVRTSQSDGIINAKVVESENGIVNAEVVQPPIQKPGVVPPVRTARGSGPASRPGLGAMAIRLGGATAAVGVFSAAVKSAANIVEQEARKLADYSGVLAGAVAETEVRRERSAIRRAERLGPGLASAERTRAKFEEVTSNAVTSIYQLLLTWYEANKLTFATILSLLTASTAFLEAIAHLAQAVIELVFKMDPAEAWSEIKKVAGSIDNGIKEIIDLWTDDEDPLDDPFIKDWLNIDAAQVRQQGNQPPAGGP